ncbi:MAG: LysR family transcriptional regulator [Proteobacteria bacterium]|nr:MAG: LysR family transcriptional regulator [Pseudomonadota bacterium]
MVRSLGEIDLNLLKAFVVVCETKKIASAAGRLNLSQPAVTAKIRKLEAEIGAELFIRSIRGVELTSVGLSFRDDVIRILSDVERAIANTSARPISGTLRIASSTTYASYLFAEVFTDFRERFPDTKVQLWSANTDEILDRVREGKARLGIVEGLSRAHGLRLEPFMQDELVLVGSPNQASRVKKLSDLQNESFIWRESGSGTRAVIQKALHEKGFPKDVFRADLEIASTEAIKSLVVRGAGLAILPRCSFKKEFALNQITVILEAQFKIERKFYWVLPSGDLDPTHKEFKAFVSKRSL